MLQAAGGKEDRGSSDRTLVKRELSPSELTGQQDAEEDRKRLLDANFLKVCNEANLT